MLNQIRLTIEPAIDHNHNMGNILHGYLLEQVDPEYGEYLHQSQLKPFSQSFYFDRQEQCWVWAVNTLSKEACENLIVPLERLKTINLEHRQQILTVREIRRQESVTYDELTRIFYLGGESRRRMGVEFFTPCSFRVQNQYLIHPSLFHIYQSLMLKFSSFSPTIKLEDETVLKHLTQHTEITDYRLRSSKFMVGKGVIKGYTGNIRLAVKGNETLAHLANLLFAFGNYSGVGIKTSLGMGAIEAEI